jgi:hypothetical protein
MLLESWRKVGIFLEDAPPRWLTNSKKGQDFGSAQHFVSLPEEERHVYAAGVFSVSKVSWVRDDRSRQEMVE